jgi:hypothetical protein
LENLGLLGDFKIIAVAITDVNEVDKSRLSLQQEFNLTVSEDFLFRANKLQQPDGGEPFY